MLRGRNVIKVGFVLSMLFPSIESRHQQILFLSISSLQIDSSCCVCAPEIPYVLEALTNISEESLVHFFLNSLWVLTSGFPGGSVGKESALQCRRHQFNPWSGKIPQRRKWQPTLVFVPGESHGQWSLASYSPWVEELDVTQQLNYQHHVVQIQACEG